MSGEIVTIFWTFGWSRLKIAFGQADALGMAQLDEFSWTLIALISFCAIFGILHINARYAWQEQKVYDLKKRVYELRKAYAEKMDEQNARDHEAEAQFQQAAANRKAA